MLPENPALPRAENYGYMVESYGALAAVLEESGSHYVIEGWPGPGALCCTPETYRAFLRDVPSPSMSVNYDPSHLIRMGIDPLRFLIEFLDRVHHVHGKDTEILAENLYTYGHEQPATFAERISYGAHSWRYTIPGQGIFRWGEGLRILAEKRLQRLCLHRTGRRQLQRRRGDGKTGHPTRRPLFGRLLTKNSGRRRSSSGSAQAKDYTGRH